MNETAEAYNKNTSQKKRIFLLVVIVMVKT